MKSLLLLPMFLIVSTGILVVTAHRKRWRSDMDVNADKNLAAYTPPGSTYPPYLSINYRNTMVEITVRSEEQPDGSQGPSATIRMNICNFGKVIDAAKKNLP